MNIHKCFLEQNECYARGGKLTPRGVMVHSTAANNTRISRYVQPDDGLLGSNRYCNHWNTYRPGCNAYQDGGSATRCAKCPLASKERRCRQKCVHAFVGRLADGTVATYQTLPWTMRGWHAGGKANDTHIGFEICEDDLSDPVYFKAVYQEAVELTASLCREFGLNPLADGVVICHSEGHRRGIASGHADVEHWFPKFGKTMDDFRRDVAETMKEAEDMNIDKLISSMTDEQALALWNRVQDALDKKPLPTNWNAAGELQHAVELGITDGSHPMQMCPRYQTAIMVARSKS